MDKYFEVIKKILYKLNKNSEIPVVCIILYKDEKIVIKTTNSRFKNNKINGHAEINALNKLYKKLKYKNFKEYTLISTLEPCKMCVGALEQTGIKNVYYYLDSPKFGASKDSSLKIKKIDNLEQENFLKEFLKEFFKKLR